MQTFSYVPYHGSFWHVYLLCALAIVCRLVWGHHCYMSYSWRKPSHTGWTLFMCLLIMCKYSHALLVFSWRQDVCGQICASRAFCMQARSGSATLKVITWGWVSSSSNICVFSSCGSSCGPHSGWMIWVYMLATSMLFVVQVFHSYLLVWFHTFTHGRNSAVQSSFCMPLVTSNWYLKNGRVGGLEADAANHSCQWPDWLLWLRPVCANCRVMPSHQGSAARLVYNQRSPSCCTSEQPHYWAHWASQNNHTFCSSAQAVNGCKWFIKAHNHQIPTFNLCLNDGCWLRTNTLLEWF